MCEDQCTGSVLTAIGANDPVRLPILVGTVGDPSTEVALRPIGVDDEPFLRDLYATSRAEELSPAPWTDEQRRTFCDAQFDLQDAHYRREFPGASFDLIECAGRSAGRLLVALGPEVCVILDMAMLPSSCGQEVSALLLCWLQGRAAARGVPVSSLVEPADPAYRLYERLGFAPGAETGLRRELVWQAQATGAEAWERFLELALRDAGLRADLAVARNDQDMATTAVGLGLTRQLAFGTEQVAAALAVRRRAWLERMVA
jgi:GNAT superfamily N-acetyltransferase